MRKAGAKQQRRTAGEEIFRAAGRLYSWRQVLAGAYFRGEGFVIPDDVAARVHERLLAAHFDARFRCT